MIFHHVKRNLLKVVCDYIPQIQKLFTTRYLSNLLYNLACSPVKLPEEKLEKEEVTVEIVEEARE